MSRQPVDGRHRFAFHLGDGGGALRRVEKAINRPAAQARNVYLDGEQLHKKRSEPGGANNPVIMAYAAARVALNRDATADPMLAEVCGRNDIVQNARNF